MRTTRGNAKLMTVAGLALTVALGAPAASAQGAAPAAKAADAAALPFAVTAVAQLDEPWAMAFLPDARILVTEKKGNLRLVGGDGRVGTISGVPTVDYGGQGGLGDVVLHPKFAQNGYVYLSYAEAGEGELRGAAVARGRLALDGQGGGALSGVQVIWRQVPKVTGRGHYGHRLAFGPDGYLYISSGERQKFDPAQDMAANLGKVLRLKDDGTVPADNPYAGQGGVAAQVWTLGHRNPLGIAFDAKGRLWEVEMGPRGGDELNLIERGADYGYPTVSNGDHYDGRVIPDHDTAPRYRAPKVWWTPVISPSSLVIYSGTQFPQWRGDALVSGLSGMALVRVDIDGTNAREAERYPMGKRIRSVAQSPDGGLWLLEDGIGGRLLKLSPRAR